MAQLQLPPDEYTDLSPKGSVDEALVDVIDEVNAVEGFVTTSSCAGRASVFLEGSRVAPAVGSGESGTVAGVGGKGGGGTWLYVSHDPFAEVAEKVDWETAFGLVKDGSEPAHDRGSDDEEKRFIHFKFEPMVWIGEQTSVKAPELCTTASSSAWGFYRSCCPVESLLT